MRRLWANLERWLVGGALLATAGLVCVQILLRAAGKAVPSLTVSFSFTEEIAKTLLVWCTMLGAAAAVRERAHLGWCSSRDACRAGCPDGCRSSG